MKELRKYATATAFRRALEERLKQLARREGIDLQRIRRQIAFDRLLAKLFHKNDVPWVLKGGYAIELRIASARTTKDIDLQLISSTGIENQKQVIWETLQDAVAIDLGDFFVFLIGQPIRDLEAAPYGGFRYPVEARMNGRTFVKFHLDLSTGGVAIKPFDVAEGRDWLAFIGIPNPQFKMISKEQQFAEKLHAYTLPRPERPNSRVKDLIDMVLLIKLGIMNKKSLASAIRAIFDQRKTHAVPKNIPQPPDDWQKPFASMARECNMSEDMDEAFVTLKEYFRLLEDHVNFRKLELEKLCKDIQEGIDQAVRGDLIDGEAVFDELRNEKIRKRSE